MRINPWFQEGSSQGPVQRPCALSARPRVASLLTGLVTAASVWLPLAASAASFPCEKAQTAIEKAICASPEVSELDEYLGRYHAAARMTLRHAEGCLVADQRAWLQSTRNACQDTACLKAAYLLRLAVLHAVQPGASSLRRVELPDGPRLVWIVPPAADQVAAPRNRKTWPLVAMGSIVDDVATGDGFVLDAGVGKKHLVTGLMFLEAPTTDALRQLSKDGASRYEVRGRTETAPSASAAFAPSQCTYVYRMAP